MQSKQRVTLRLIGKNTAIGVAIALVVHILFPPHNLVTRQLANLASDVLIQLGFFETHQDPHSLLRPLVFVDIDDETHRAWGESRPTPRQELAKLLAVLLAQKPALVVVDLDLSWKSGEVANSESLRLALEKELLRAQEEERPSRIILVRRVITDVDSRGSNIRQWLRPLFFEQDASIAETLLARQLIGTVTYAVDGDGVVRRWRLLETGCRNDNGEAALAVQVLVAAYLGKAVEPLEKLRASIAQQACAHDKIAPTADAVKITNKLVIPSSALTEPNRMLLRFKWDRARYGTDEMLYYAGKHIALLQTMSAAEVLRTRIDTKIPRDLEDAIILVGATHYDSGDRHMTPIGELPGSFLVLNSIYSLLERGIMKAASWGSALAAELLLVTLLAIVFTYISAGFSVWVGIFAGLALLFGCAVVFFYFGVWFDYFTPLVGVFVHQWYRNVEDRHELDELRKRDGAKVD